MSWAIVAVGAGAAISAGGSYLSSSSQQKGAADAASAVGSSSAFGTVPEAAEYKPVNFDDVQLQSVLGSTHNLGAINNLVGAENDATTQQAIRRAKRLIPGYKSLMQTYSAAGNDLLHAKLPFDDVLGTVSERNELSNHLGLAGAGAPATLKDLGLSKLDAVSKGGGILKDMVGMAETISPIGRYDTASRWTVSPLDRINLEMQQNQLIQQSDQNKFNLAAAGDPAAYAQLQLMLAQSGSAGSPAGSALSALGSGISGLGSSGAFSGSGASGASSASTGWRASASGRA